MHHYLQGEFFEPNAALSIRLLDDARVCPPHTHDFFEFVYTERGGGVHRIDGKEYRAGPGAMLFINFGQTHEYLLDEGTAFYNILVRPEYIGSALTRESEAVYNLFSLVMQSGEENQSAEFGGEERERATALVHLLAHEAEAKEADYREAENAAFNLLLILLLRKIGGVGLSYGRLRPVVDYLKEHFAEPLSLKDISEKFFYNSSYFSRLFKQFVGVGFRAYVDSLRMKKAVELAERTDLSAEEIAGIAGYGDVKRLYERFRRVTGLTFGEYRRRERERAAAPSSPAPDGERK